MEIGKAFLRLWDAAQLTQEPRPVGPERDRTAYLMGTLTLGGINFHVELYAVTYTDDEQIGALPDDQWAFDDVNHAFGGGAFDTIEINGREYAMIISPYMR